MSATSDIVVMSSAVGREKCVTWVNTFYQNLNPYTLANWNPNVIWISKPGQAEFVDIEFEFQFVRISELEFKLTCIKNFAPPGEYTFNFQCSVNVFDGRPEVFKMESSEKVHFKQIWLDTSYRDRLTSEDLNKVLEMKIVVKMIEYNCESNDAYLHQEAELQAAIEEFLPNESVLNDMCYILDVPRLQDIFTGRQNNEFALLKTLYISRAASFAKEIADYMRAKGSCTPPPETEIKIILNFILKGERAPISNQDVLQAYKNGHHLGLNFLVLLSRDCISEAIGNLNFNLEALKVTHSINDEKLFEIFAEDFDSIEARLPPDERSDVLGQLRNTSIQCRFVVLSLESRRKKIQSEREPVNENLQVKIKS